MEKLSVIVPCFNEQETLQDYYDAISKVRESLLGKECELQVILVDDGSKDKTLAKMKELSGQCSWIRYISFTRNFGKEAAMYAGLQHARGEYVAIMDADLQHPPAMLKEMYEQPKTVRDTLSPRIKDGKIEIEELGMTDEEIRAINRIHIVACGSAYHTGVTAKYVFEGMARIPVEVDLASEFRYRNPILDENDLDIIVSLSGETADSLAALREAKSQEIKTLGIVNVDRKGSR